jgi:hypothetical protein
MYLSRLHSFGSGLVLELKVRERLKVKMVERVEVVKVLR